MRLSFFFLISICLIISCNEKNVDVDNFKVDTNVIPNSISKRLIQKNNSIISLQSLAIGSYKYPASNEDYVCKASIIENDTLNIWLNNYNGHFGNGVLAQVFDNQFRIKSVTPKVIKGTKFENYELKSQELILNKSAFKKGDSLFGYLNFECVVDSSKTKKISGYFRTIIQ